MVQKLSYTANSITLGTGTSRVVLGADSGNLIVKDSDANTSIVEPGVGVQGQTGVATYANSSVLPFSPISPAGSLAYTTATGALYLSNGSGWYKITMVNTTPTITLSSTTATATLSDLTLDFTYTVTEPEGTPTTVTLANSGIATTGNVAITHTTSNNHVRLVFDGETVYNEDATVTLSVTDGVNIGTGTITLTTQYYDGKDSKNEVLLLKAFTDTNLTTTQKSIGLNGVDEHLTIPLTTLGLGTGDFTIESWVYLRSRATNFSVVWSNYSTYTTGGMALFAGHQNHTTTYTLSHGGLTFPSINGGTLNYDKWDHLAVVRNSGTITMYQNGISIGSFSSTTNLAGVGSNFFIGNSGDVLSTGYNHADYSNFRIVVGTAVYTGNFTPPTGPLTKTGGTYSSTTNVNTSITASHTKLLTAQGSTTDNSDGGLTVTSVGTPDVAHHSPYSNPGTPFDDLSSNNHRFAVSGTPRESTFSPHRDNGYSTYFDGSDYLRDDTIGDDMDATGTTNCDNFTIELWIWNYDDPTDSDYFISSNATANGANDFLFGANKVYWNASQIGISYGADYGYRYQWQHYVLMHEYNPDTGGQDIITLWIDGRRIFRSTGNSRISFANNTFAFGTEADAANFGSLGNYFHGYLYDVKITKAALYTSTDEFIPVPTTKSTAHPSLNIFHGMQTGIIDERFTVGGGVDTEPWTALDRVKQYSGANHGGSIYFDGSGDVITTTTAGTAGVGVYTMECWFYIQSLQTGALMAQRPSDPTTGNYAQWLLYVSSGGELKMYNGVSGDHVFNAGSVSVGRWYHVAVTRNSSFLVTCYLNGESKATRTNQTANWNYAPFSVGANANGEQPFKGYISDVRWMPGTLKYTGNFTIPSAPLTAETGTNILLSGAGSQIFDTSQTTKTEGLSITGPVMSPAIQHFSENTISFDGTNDTIGINDVLQRKVLRLASYDDNDYGTRENWTIESWIYKTNTAEACLYSQRDSSTAEIGLFLDHNISGYSAGDVSIEYDSAQYTFDAGIIQNAWQHIAYQRNGTKVQWYSGGVLKDVRTEPASLINYAATAYIGSWQGSSRWFGGYMHDFRITNGTAKFPYHSTPITLTQTNSGMTKLDNTTVTATASNVKFLGCHASTIVDGSPDANTITVNGDTSVSTFSPDNNPASSMRSLKFDGSGDHISAPVSSAPGTDDWTVEYWVYHNDLGSDNEIHVSFGTYAPAFYYRGSGSNYRFTLYHAGAGLSGNVFMTIRPQEKKWYHLAWVHDTSENKVALFIDGAFYGDVTYSGNITSTALTIGDDNTSSWMDGYISNLRYTKQKLYTSNFTPRTSPLQ